MTPADERRARPADDPDLLAVVDATPAEEPAQDRAPRRAPRWLPLLALAVPVVVVVAVLGWRAAAGPAFDPDVAGDRVGQVADGILASADGAGFAASGASGPGTAMSGGSSDAPEPGAHDVTVVCASERGRGAHLAVAVAGETVGEADVACSDGADPDADPLVTVLPLDELGAGWSFAVESGTRAAVAVVLS
ncbi:hypothetical protein FA014_03880 [Cellulomonas hominis]|uniref:Uncharacterized protein n=1 Tax=Cellulomonas hominis TaxID=156981 RepID=A0A7Z8K118_9CELL|nr:hypothetical protein [Cellulomonas hominis]TKR26793.1 hypothetical protein FA014_03880 [Cellulomonas hominis]